MAKARRSGNTDETTVLFVRGMSRDVLARMKAAAALHHQTLAEYVHDLFKAHLQELERKGLLPKPKG